MGEMGWVGENKYHEPIPEHDVLRKVLLRMSMMHLMRAHRVVDPQKVQPEVVTRVVEARTRRLEQQVSRDRRHMQTRSVRDDIESDPVERERDELFERMLVRAVNVTARRECVAVVVLVHVLVQRRPMHQAVCWRVQHVVDDEEEPERDWSLGGWGRERVGT